MKTSRWLRFGMFRHPAQAVGSYSSGPPAAGTVGTKSTGGFYICEWSPCRFLQCSYLIKCPILPLCWADIDEIFAGHRPHYKHRKHYGGHGYNRHRYGQYYPRYYHGYRRHYGGHGYRGYYYGWRFWRQFRLTNGDGDLEPISVLTSAYRCFILCATEVFEMETINLAPSVPFSLKI